MTMTRPPPRDPAEHPGERVELALQRRLGLLHRREHRRDLTHLRGHAGVGDHDGGGAPGDLRVLEHHVRPVAERRLGIRDRRGILRIGALSPVRAASWVSRVAERRIRPSAGTMSPASTAAMSPGTTSVEGDLQRPVADDPSLRDLHLRQRVDRGLGLHLGRAEERRSGSRGAPRRCPRSPGR